jgi:hypothetical protein
MSLLLLSYVLVPIAFVLMMKNYQATNWLWLGFLTVSVFIGIAPFVALAYLVTAFVLDKNNPKQGSSASTVTYHPDGSYTVYKVEDTKTAPSAGKLAFRIVGGLIAGAAICFGLLIVGLMLLVTVSCGGNSKCM